MENNTGKAFFKSMVWFIGVVEDVVDPSKINRVRVRCIGFHPTDKTLLPTVDLPWAPFVNSTSAMSAPIVNNGDWVVGFFIDGDQAQQPVILGSIVGIPESAADPSQGFNDPTGKHPKHPGEGTNSRHARGEEGTPDENAVAFTKSSTVKGVPTAAGGKFAEPPSQFAAKYPLNHVMETDGGHVFELDDTPNAERVQLFHKRGSFFEFHPNGSTVYRTANNNFQVIFENNNIYVGGDCNISAVGKVNIISGGDTNISTKGNANWRVGGNFNLDIGGSYNVVAGGAGNLDFGGKTIIYADGNMELQATRIDLNKGSGKPLGSPKAPETIEKAKGGVTAFEVLAAGDEQPKTLEEVNAIRQANGFEPVPADEKPAEGESSTPPPGGEKKDIKCGDIVLQSDYKKVQLSKNFTLADLTANGTRKLVDAPALANQKAAAADEILCNLKKLAENVLEPLKAAGIKFRINSGYRPDDANGQPGTGHMYKASDHLIGKAVDISFTDLSAYQGAQRCWQLVGSISKQFLLEYTSGAGPGWVHIAYHDGPKSGLPMATFNNHSTYAANKLVDLRAG